MGRYFNTMGQLAWAEINSRLTSSQLNSGYSTPKILQYNRLCGMGRDQFKTDVLTMKTSLFIYPLAVNFDQSALSTLTVLTNQSSVQVQFSTTTRAIH